MLTAASFLLALAPLAPADKLKLRVGHFPNVTHAQGVIAHGLSRAGKGWFEERLGPDVEIEWYVYNAGPTAMEAMLAGSLDLTYVGPNPALNAHIRSEGDEIRIVAGAASGGAALVVQPDGRIAKDQDFKGKRVASPQLGNTQDVAARSYFKSKGYKITQTGGDVLVIPTANADQLALFQKGDLDAVWTVEPWVTRLELEAKGKIYLEEKTLWPETKGRYVTTHLVSSVAFLEKQSALLEKFIAAHVELTDWINAHPDEARAQVRAGLSAEVRREIPEAVVAGSWRRLRFTAEVDRAQFDALVAEAQSVGFLRDALPLDRLFSGRP